jgi:hypothetical protein
MQVRDARFVGLLVGRADLDPDLDRDCGRCVILFDVNGEAAGSVMGIAES